MKRINRFNENKWVEKSDPMISRGSVSIYEMSTYGSFLNFVRENKDIFMYVHWSINPLSYQDNYHGTAEGYFNAYRDKYPNFYVLIDYDKEKVYGVSVGTYVYCIDKNDRHFPLYQPNLSMPYYSHMPWERTASLEILDYLNKLHLKIEDLK